MTLHTKHLTSLEQIESFLDGTAEIDFRAPDRTARRAWHQSCCLQASCADAGRSSAPRR